MNDNQHTEIHLPQLTCKDIELSSAILPTFEESRNRKIGPIKLINPNDWIMLTD